MLSFIDQYVIILAYLGLAGFMLFLIAGAGWLVGKFDQWLRWRRMTRLQRLRAERLEWRIFRNRGRV